MTKSKNGTITKEEFNEKKKQVLESQGDIVIKGIPQKNKFAVTVVIISAVLLLASFIVSFCVFAGGGEKNYDYGYNISWFYIYDSFGEFFTAEFFNFECFYGYTILLGIVALIVGLIMKFNTEKCEIVVTDSNIFGRLAHGRDVNIPLNQVTALNSVLFNGISVSSIGNVNNFYCIKNRDEVMKAISYLFVNPQLGETQSPGIPSSMTFYEEAEQLKGLKELLDSGILTQEEFDEKKKRILGL